jgi:GTP-binding protein HflX
VLQAETVEQVLADLGMGDVPLVVAANKVDAIAATAGATGDQAPGEREPEAVGDTPGLDHLRDLYPDLVPISALEGKGLDQLLQAIDHELQSRLVDVDALVPYDAGDVLNLLHTHGIVDAETFEESGTRVKARIPRYLVGSVEQYELSAPDDRSRPE